MSERKKGSTSVSFLFRLTDATTGTAKAGLDVTSLSLQYGRPGEAAGAATALTALASLTSAWTAYGAKEVDPTNSKGIYRVDCPNAAFAAGADEVAVSVSGSPIETSTRLIDLTAFDSRDGVRGGLTSLPNAPASAANGLLTVGVGMGQMNPTSGKAPATLAAADVTGKLPVSLAASDVTGKVAATLAPADVGGPLPANVAQWAGSGVASPNTAGVPKVDLVSVNGSAAAGVSSVDANLVSVNGTTFAGANVPSSAVQWGGVGVGGMPLAAAVYTPPPSAAAIDAQLAGSHGAGAWNALSYTPAQVAAAVWTDTGDLVTPGTPGYLVAQNLDARVSSRSTFAGGAVAAVTAPVTVGANNDKTGYLLAAGGLDAVPVETGVNARQALSPILAASAGVLTGAGTSTVVFKGGNTSLTRITASTDNAGNRTAVTLSLPT